MASLPAPTDDELLLCFVDDCPSQATQDYLARNGLWHIVRSSAEEWSTYRDEINALFKSEWARRRP